MTDSDSGDGGLPSWAVTDGRPDAEKIMKNLYRYGYAIELDGEVFIDKKLNQDYPALFHLLYNYKMSQMTEKYTDMISEGKFEAYRDGEGKLKYRMVDESE